MKLLISIILIFLISCSGGTGNKKSYADLVENGWAQFESKNYSEAIESFKKAVDKDDSKSEAFTGMAWANLKLKDVAWAHSSFSDAISKSDASADSFAGSAFVLNAQKNYELSNSSTASVVQKNTSW